MLIDKIFRLCLSHWSAAICNISVRISVCLSNLHAHHMAHYLFCPMKINSDTISMYLLPKFVDFTLILPCILSRKVQGKDRCDQNQNGHIAKMDDFTHFWSIVSTIHICIWPFSLNQAINQPFNSTLADAFAYSIFRTLRDSTLSWPPNQNLPPFQVKKISAPKSGRIIRE